MKSTCNCRHGAIGQEKLCNFEMVGKYDEITAYRFWWTGIRNLGVLLKYGRIVAFNEQKEVDKYRCKNGLNSWLTPLLQKLIIIFKIVDFSFAAVFTAVVIVFVFACTACNRLIMI